MPETVTPGTESAVCNANNKFSARNGICRKIWPILKDAKKLGWKLFIGIAPELTGKRLKKRTLRGTSN
jgi:hypothetical protein